MVSKVKTEEWWRKKCVTDAKKIARLLVKKTCAYCGKKEPNILTHGSHIYPESVYKSMSADIDNILCLCADHHSTMYGRKPRDWNWHANPIDAINWFKENYPELDNKLRIRSQKTRRINWEKKRTELRAQLKELDLS